jgi:pimeloyl-ACP methyl ester carboxylesterase
MSLDEGGYRRIGGIDQWVLMRGQGPPLILLHGGPGMTETTFFRRCNAPLERAFTVVYWDQRGAGKSFHAGIPRSSMKVERFIADLDELVELVRARTGHEKVALFGHSWGSALGVLHAARFPDKVMAYVGCGQVGDSQASERATYAWLLGEAERRRDRRMLKRLRAIGPPPHDARRLLVQRMALARVEGRMKPAALWKLARLLLGAEESSLFDLVRALRGFRFSLDSMWDEVTRIDLPQAVPALAMPVFFFLGRHDRTVAAEVSADYFDVLRAPSKELVWFEHSRHEPFLDEPAKLNAAMLEKVRPLCAGIRAAAPAATTKTERPAPPDSRPTMTTTTPPPDASPAQQGRRSRIDRAATKDPATTTDRSPASRDPERAANRDR